jgi:lipopolysaccharide/colanic/teichoic acid biosynthesis glycosyltransferase
VNIVKGEMSWVGVRPQVERFVAIFHDQYEGLSRTAPGITDLASLGFRDEESFVHESSNEVQYIAKILPFELEKSLKYSRTRALLDLEMFFRTVLGFQSSSTAWSSATDPTAHSLSEFVSRDFT